MSLILDALRRADAERQRGQTPALQQVTQAPLSTGSTGPRFNRGPWLAAATVLLLAAGAALWAWRPTASPAVPATRPATAPAPAAVTATPAPPPAVPPLPSAAPRRAPVPTPAPSPTPAPTAAAPAAPPPALAAVPVPVPVPVSVPARAPSPASATAAVDDVQPLSSLPEAQRATIARLGFGGAVQSQDRGQSFVLMGGQLVREGDLLAPGIVLDRIEARSLLLRIDGRRVRVPL